MKITPSTPTTTVRVKTQNKKETTPSDWWNGNSKKEVNDKLISTVSFLKEQSQYRFRQASIFARLYGNLPLFGWIGTNLNKLGTQQLPIDRPTMSVITSCVDTLVSRLTQSRPKPIFLGDNTDYKQRNLAKHFNQFIAGELYQTKAYELGATILRDASVLGTGVIKILEDMDNRVALERRLNIELLDDPNDSFYGSPRQLYEVKLVERSVLLERFPKYRSNIENAEQAFPDNSAESAKTVSDLVLVAEGWRLPSGPKANDGLHAIGCTSGPLFDEPYKKQKFPFVFLDYAPRMIGLWAQGLPERQMGTQMEINKLLMTISNSINLVGVPRVFVEDGSKVVKAQLNNAIGSIVTYRGTKPSYEVAPCVPAELYDQLQRLILYAYQQEGISQLTASSQKPSGLSSGEALRQYDDIQADRFAALNKRYDNMYIDLTYQIIDKAKDIAERDGKYETVYPGKDGTRKIDLPAVKTLEDPFVIQCYDMSSLPKDPAGRSQRIVEFMQAGIYSQQEGRRLLNFSDTEQIDKLAVAAEERIFQILDKIVEEGKYTPPDPFMDLTLASQLVVQYYNLYMAADLEEEKAQLLRDFSDQVLALKAEAMQPALGGASPQANPMATPQSELLPNVPTS